MKRHLLENNLLNYLLDGKFTENFNWGEAILQTFAMFFTEDNWGLKPKSRFGEFFADSIYVIAASTITLAVVMLLQPVFLRNPATVKEHRKAEDIVQQYGHSSLAAIALLNDKSYYFSPSGQSIIAYVPKGRGAIALGDPIGPIADRKIVHNPDGGVDAFTNIMPKYQRNQGTVDLMLHRQSMENGTMDFLFTSLLQHLQNQGYDHW